MNNANLAPIFREAARLCVEGGYSTATALYLAAPKGRASLKLMHVLCKLYPEALFGCGSEETEGERVMMLLFAAEFCESEDA